MAEEQEEFTWVDNPTEAGVANCDPDVLNSCLMYLRYNHASGGGGGLPPTICRNLTLIKNGLTASIKWQDPDDTIIDGKYLATWGGTKIVRKAGSYPENEKDGVLVVDNIVKNQYADTPFIDTIEIDEENDEEVPVYYYKAFPYSTNGCTCYNDKNNFNDAIIYEFVINPNESNPDARVSYPAGCMNEDFTPAYMEFGSAFRYGSWENAFFMPRPVMLSANGSVDYELYKHDFSYKADGVTRSDIANDSYNGNVMIEFPQVYFKFEMDGTLQHVYVSNKKVDDNYHCYTHYNKNGVLLDHIYIMAYQPCNVSSKLRSLSGKTICTGQSGTTEISWAQANGDGWNIWDYGEWQMLQWLGVLMCKSTNLQAKFGTGRESGANGTTGECNTDGMFFGTNGNGRLKYFGIENAWGNYWKRMNGCVYNTTDGLKYKLCDFTEDGTDVIGYNTDGTGYKKHQTFSGSSGGYISKMDLNADGIFPSVASGSSTTYWCDGLWWANGGFAFVGGSYNGGAWDGGFCLYLYDAVSYGYSNIGGSLSCKPL